MVTLNELFEQFSSHVGIPVSRDRNGQLVSITTLKKKNVLDLEITDSKAATAKQTEESSEKASKMIEEGSKFVSLQDLNIYPKEKSHVWEDSENLGNVERGIIRTSNQTYLQQNTRYLSRFRFIVFIHSLNEIPVQQIKTQPPRNFWIEIEVLDQVLKYKIEPAFLQADPKNPDLCRIDMNRFSIKYFFSNKRQGLRNYIQEAKCMHMRLKCNEEVIFKFQIELQDFVSEQVPTRNYSKYFAVETDYLKKLTWELVFTLGVHEGDEVDTAGMLLKDYKGIVVPPPEYFSYEKLPMSWVKLLEKNDVVNPLYLTPEMDDYAQFPTYKIEPIGEFSKPSLKMTDPHYQMIENEASIKVSNMESVGLDYLPEADEEEIRYKMDEYGEDRDHYRSEVKSKHIMTKLAPHWKSQEVPPRSLNKSNENHSENSARSEKNTDAGDDVQAFKRRSQAETMAAEDTMLLDELNSYNKNLNRQVGRVLNDIKK